MIIDRRYVCFSCLYTCVAGLIYPSLLSTVHRRYVALLTYAADEAQGFPSEAATADIERKNTVTDDSMRSGELWSSAYQYR